MKQTKEEFIAGILARAKHARKVKRMPNTKSSIPSSLPDVEPPPTELEAIEKGI